VILYRIRKADGREYGPATPEEIRKWLATGFVFERTLARMEGATEWKELSQFIEITGLPAPDPKLGTLSSNPPPAAVLDNSLDAEPDESLAKISRNLGLACILTSVCMVGFLLTIPAIACGHVAYYRARAFPHRYGGLHNARVGMMLGYAGLCFMLILLTLVAPQFRQARLKASSPKCATNLSLIWRANMAWASNHNGLLAPQFLSLSNELRNPFSLVCPSLQDYPNWNEQTDWSTIDVSWFSYQYLTPGAALTTASNQVMLRCPRHLHMAHGDGRIELAKQGGAH
jgi:hypothetical protein